MASVTYEVVAHDGGYAYKVGDVFSVTFRTHAAAREAAQAAARRQQEAGGTEAIQYEDADGVWHTEVASGSDRPAAEVHDTLEERPALGASSPRRRADALFEPRSAARQNPASGR
jgi:hypothetical protein